MTKDKNLHSPRPVVHQPAVAADVDDWSYPQYQVVCVSRNRLGDCGEFYYVKDSVAGTMGDGQKACWLRLTDAKPPARCANPPEQPNYQVVCYSQVRLGDCGTYWNVVDSTAGCMTDGTTALWLLVK